MAVSKRTRFEVLRRDNYTCRYCKSTKNTLTIDHVTPVSLGGTDDPGNLVACCKDCNAGKASTSPDAATVSDVSDDAVRWAKARAEAAAQLTKEIEDREERALFFLQAWSRWDASLTFLPVDFDTSVNRWLDAGLTDSQVTKALSIALENDHVQSGGVWRYTCGIIRNWLTELDIRTAQILAEGNG